MEKPVLILFLFLYLMILSQASLDSKLPEKVKAEGYRLHLQWPSAFCYSQSQHCVAFRKASFTIHGLYFLNKKKVVNCPKEPQPPPLPPDAVSDIKNELKYEWPNLLGDDLWFWTHEWRKHGSCHETWTARDYFRNALDARNTVKTSITNHYKCSPTEDVFCALSKNSITPGGSYRQSAFFDAFRWMSGGGIGIKCNPRGEQNNDHLLELIFCFDVNLQLQSCSNLIESCPENIFYVPDRGNISGWTLEMHHARNVSLIFLPFPEAKGAVDADCIRE